MRNKQYSINNEQVKNPPLPHDCILFGYVACAAFTTNFLNVFFPPNIRLSFLITCK